MLPALQLTQYGAEKEMALSFVCIVSINRYIRFADMHIAKTYQLTDRVRAGT